MARSQPPATHAATDRDTNRLATHNRRRFALGCSGVLGILLASLLWIVGSAPPITGFIYPGATLTQHYSDYMLLHTPDPRSKVFGWYSTQVAGIQIVRQYDYKGDMLSIKDGLGYEGRSGWEAALPLVGVWLRVGHQIRVQVETDSLGTNILLYCAPSCPLDNPRWPGVDTVP